jgi:lipid-binding SYLF domain-containing protein
LTEIPDWSRVAKRLRSRFADQIFKPQEERMKRRLYKSYVAAIGLFALGVCVSAAQADDKATAEETVTSAAKTFNTFVADPDMTWFRDHIKNAKAVMIVPQLVKAGFIFGGSGGTGVVSVHDDATGDWSYPSFATVGSVSWGLQAGAEAAEVVLMAMTVKGRDSLLSTKAQLGADASVAAGPVGAGAQAATVDILQFSRSKGIFGGLTLEGSVVGVREKLNHAYYGQPVQPVDILISRTVTNPQAAPLLKALAAGK